MNTIIQIQMIPRKLFRAGILAFGAILFLMIIQGMYAENTGIFQNDQTSLIPSVYSPSDNFSNPELIPLAEHPGTGYPGTPDVIEPDIRSEEQAFDKPYRSDAILVRFTPGSDSLSYRTHSPINSQVIYDYSKDGIAGLELVAPPEKLSIEEAVSYYQSKPGVIYAEPDYYRFSMRIPSDPEFWRQWGMLNTGQTFREGTQPGIPGADLKAVHAWDMATGGDTIVAVLDSGVDYLHPDLQANIWTDPLTGTFGYDAITGDLEAMDLASHGTHCAGIIGAVGDDGLGVAGVTWNTRIMPVRFLNSFGTGTVSDEIEAILWATRNGARIISCSYGGSSYSRAEYEVMKESNALFICAAGNNNLDIDANPYYPAAHDLSNLITVAATDSTDSLADFSNYGLNTVDLAAPGVDIYSTKHNVYKPVPIWTETFDNLYNWTTHGNWTLDSTQFVSPNTSASGHVNQSSSDSYAPVILTLKTPLKISGITEPVFSYQWSMVGMNYSFTIEGSNNAIAWTPLESGKGQIIIAPFMKREFKIPVDLRNSPLFIRFVANGDFCLLGLDDITLSDGYGELAELRWGYMSGSSMACPMVSGTAALLASAAPDASLTNIKTAILKTVDPLPSLSGKTTTGGRVNLTAALTRITGGSSYHLQLSPGWNHVSVPFRLIGGDDTAMDVFGSLTNVSGHSLYRFQSGDWITVRPEEHIAQLTSYWVYTEEVASLPLMVDAEQTKEYKRNLMTGWNGIGVIGEEEIPARQALQSLGDIWSYVIGFNVTTQMSDEPIIRGGEGKHNETRPLLPYLGYWVYLTRNGTLEKNDRPDIPEETKFQPVWPQPLR